MCAATEQEHQCAAQETKHGTHNCAKNRTNVTPQTSSSRMTLMRLMYMASSHSSVTATETRIGTQLADSISTAAARQIPELCWTHSFVRDQDAKQTVVQR